jgi:hypothetical protein
MSNWNLYFASVSCDERIESALGGDVKKTEILRHGPRERRAGKRYNVIKS